jgi:hypothetical protein
MPTPAPGTRRHEWSSLLVLAGLWLVIAVAEVGGQVLVPPARFCFRAWECVTSWSDDRVPFRPLASWTGTAHGDLANLMGVPQLMGSRPQHFSTDEYGFRNPRGQLARRPRVVVAGDSFAAGGQLSDHEVLGARLEARLGVAVYTYAPLGTGALLLDERFLTDPPEVVVALHAEGNLSARDFEVPAGRRPFSPPAYGSVEQVRRARSGGTPLERARTALERRSVARWLAEPAWKGALWATGLYRLPPKIDSVDREDGWIYYLRGTRHYTQPELAIDQLPSTVAAMSAAADALAARGTRLLVVLAPEKEAVYRDRLPELDAVDVSLFSRHLARALASAGVEHLMLLPHLDAFRARRPAVDLYFPDDTHLTAAGHELMAELVAARCGELVSPGPRGPSGAGSPW